MASNQLEILSTKVVKMPDKIIASAQNPSFKLFVSLLSGRGLKKHELTIVSGGKNVGELLNDFPELVRGLIISSDYELNLEIDTNIKVYRLEKSLFKQIDLYGAKSPLILMQARPLEKWVPGEPASGCTLFVPFQDPANVGAVVRTAAAFGVNQVVMLKEAANPWHHRAVKVAGSAIFRISMASGPSINDLAGFKGRLITLDMHGQNLAGYKFPKTFGLLPGIEGPGLPDSMSDRVSLSISMKSGAESLNAAQAVGIALYEWSRM